MDPTPAQVFSPAPPVPAASAPKLKRWAMAFVSLVFWSLVTLWLLFGLVWGALHGVIVPRIGDFRERLEQSASAVLGVDVRIAAISAQSSGWMPSFELQGVVLLDSSGREALRLPRVRAALSPTSLLKKGVEQLQIDQPVLEIRRATDGKIYVGGLDVSSSKDGAGANSAFADWVFDQSDISIEGGTLRWTDEMRRAPPLALSQVNMVLRSTLRRHEMRLDATPPQEWGARFSVRAKFREPLLSVHKDGWETWAGEVFAEFDRVDVSRVRQYADLASSGIDVAAGSGSLRAWAEVRAGALVGATADLALLEVQARLGKSLKPLALESITGRLGGRKLPDGYEFKAEALSFSTPDGLRWPGGNVALRHLEASATAAEQTSFTADKLDLAAMAQIANRLPLGTATHSLIESFAPKGLVQAVQAQWDGPIDAPTSYSLKGQVAGLSLAGQASGKLIATRQGPGQSPEQPGRPGVSGAAVEFELNQLGGRAAVQVAQGALVLPGVFENPSLSITSMSLDAQWKTSGAKTALQVRNFKFTNTDFQGTAQADWQTIEVPPARAGTPATLEDYSLGRLELQGVLSRADGASVHRYLPVAINQRVRHYIRDAIGEGEMNEVKFKIAGPVDDIPFSTPAQGEFKISTKLKNTAYAFGPKVVPPSKSLPWPALSELKGELAFNRAAMELTGASGKLAGLQVDALEARIPDLNRNATVVVSAKLKGPISNALALVNTSPLGALTSNALAKATATGAADYAFKLTLPIDAVDTSKVEGVVLLANNDVQFSSDTPLLSRLKGSVTFTETGFNISSAQARVLGGDIRFEGGTPKATARAAAPGAAPEADPPSVSFRAQGSATAEGLRQAKELGYAARLAQSASGTAAYTATLAIRRGTTEVAVSSNLAGMALNLPSPLDKTAESALPFRFENSLMPGSLASGEKLQDQLSLSLGKLGSLLYVRDISGPEPRVIKGSIGVGLEGAESAPLPETGVVANISLAKADLDAWEKALLPTTAGASNNASSAPTGPSAYLPTRAAIRAKELVLAGRKLTNVVVGGSREGSNWRANVDAAELNGYVEFRQPSSTGMAAGAMPGAGRVFARLSRLSLAQSTASEMETLLDEQPTNIPALDIVIDDFELRGRKLGRIEIEAVNRGLQSAAVSGGVREWRLNKFNVTLPEAVLTASGNWAAVNAQAAPSAARVPARSAERRRTVMNFKLDIADSGLLLKRFGMADVVRRGKGKMEGQVSWVGSPLSLDFPSLGGQFAVGIESGQFLKADPGMAKLLGVLSLQSLPRRLALDFTDVFSEGFAFDFVRGDVAIAQGVASTNNLQMKGVNAAVLMEGSADIGKETQELMVVVVPEINAGTASLIATVINPAIGLGTFLAQYFLRRPLMQAATQEFRISGTWIDPKVTKVEKKP